MSNHYDLLGVAKTATADEIRSAYLKLAKEYHPDKTGGDKEKEDKLKEINAAYDILKDKTKKAAYDNELSATSASGWANINGMGSMRGGLRDIFESMQQQTKFAEEAMALRSEASLTITLEEAYTGCQKEVTYRRASVCEACNGVGGKETIACTNCHGTGFVTRLQGFTQITNTCPHCRGTGKKILDKCPKCQGRGRIYEDNKVVVTIPRGLPDHSIFPMPGYGGIGLVNNQKMYGDLHVLITIAPHKDFIWQNDDLIHDLIIKVPQGVLGDKVKVPLISGKMAEVEIPAGIQSGSSIRLPGMGMPNVNDNKKNGHLYIRVFVQIPNKKDLSDCELQAYNSLMACLDKQS